MLNLKSKHHKCKIFHKKNKTFYNKYFKRKIPVFIVRTNTCGFYDNLTVLI